MQVLKPLILSGLLAIGTANAVHAVNTQVLIEPASKKLDDRFFYWLFEKENLQKAYILAQKEDFESGEKVLFTPEMLALFKMPKKDWEEKLGDLGPLWNLEGELKSLNGESSAALLQEWRYTFLNRIMEFMRLQNSRKPTFKAMVLNELSSDSNVKRVTDEDYAVAGDPSGKSDGQHMVFANLKWMPLVNNTHFNKKNEFEQGFNVIRMHQFAHEENQVTIFDTESKYTRKIGGALDDFSVAYRIQNFGLGSVGTRQTHSLFNTHRFKSEWNLSPMPLGGAFENTICTLGLAYTMKAQLNDVDERAGKDADEIRITWDQKFNYKFSRLKGDFVTTLEYNDYNTERYAAGDYDYWSAKIKNTNKFSLAALDNSLRLNEELGLRNKSWNTNLIPSDEDTYWVQLKASTKLSPRLDSYLTLKQSWIDTKDRNVGKDADQTIVALGLMWSTP